jgi:hypothetical protein
MYKLTPLVQENGLYYDVPRRLDSSQFIVYHPRDLETGRTASNLSALLQKYFIWMVFLCNPF